MPKRHEGKDHRHVQQGAGDAGFGPGPGPAGQGHVNVSHNPSVEGAVPATPEGQGRIVVAHTPHHIFWRVHAVHQTPEPEEAPGDQQFQPDNVQVEVREHGQLKGRVEFRPVRLARRRMRFGNGHHVDGVEEELHAEQGQEEANRIKGRAGSGK